MVTDLCRSLTLAAGERGLARVGGDAVVAGARGAAGEQEDDGNEQPDRGGQRDGGRGLLAIAGVQPAEAVTLHHDLVEPEIAGWIEITDGVPTAWDLTTPHLRYDTAHPSPYSGNGSFGYYETPTSAFYLHLLTPWHLWEWNAPQYGQWIYNLPQADRYDAHVQAPSLA
jgi:hypothetical protein